MYSLSSFEVWKPVLPLCWGGGGGGAGGGCGGRCCTAKYGRRACISHRIANAVNSHLSNIVQAAGFPSGTFFSKIFFNKGWLNTASKITSTPM